MNKISSMRYINVFVKNIDSFNVQKTFWSWDILQQVNLPLVSWTKQNKSMVWTQDLFPFSVQRAIWTNTIDFGQPIVLDILALNSENTVSFQLNDKQEERLKNNITEINQTNSQSVSQPTNKHISSQVRFVCCDCGCDCCYFRVINFRFKSSSSHRAYGLPHLSSNTISSSSSSQSNRQIIWTIDFNWLLSESKSATAHTHRRCAFEGRERKR